MSCFSVTITITKSKREIQNHDDPTTQLTVQIYVPSYAPFRTYLRDKFKDRKINCCLFFFM